MKTLIKLLFIVIVGVGAYFFYVSETREDLQPSVDVEEVSYQDIVAAQQDAEELPSADEATEDKTIEEEEEPIEDSDEPENEEEETVYEEIDGIPAQFNLAVPFTAQAPHADWSLPYQEACEEASAYMVSEYYKGQWSGQIDPDVADAELLDVVAFQEDFFGYYLDTTAAETAQFIDFFYGLSAEVIENPTVEQIKREVAAGRPVIIPAAGRQLGNPNFSGQGPLYHMLVIRGYTQSKFITNDPGTRNGEGFVYDIDVIMEAIGDWNNGDPANGAKRVIFVRPVNTEE